MRLAPWDVRCGVPQGAQFIREWGRPARAPAFAAGLGTAGLPCVALFLAFREVPLTPKQSFDAGLRGYPRERVMSGSGARQSRSIPFCRQYERVVAVQGIEPRTLRI